MAFDGNDLVVNDRNLRSQDSAEGAYYCWWKTLRRACAEIFPGFENVYILFVGHSDELKYVFLLHNLPQKVADTGTLNLACC